MIVEYDLATKKVTSYYTVGKFNQKLAHLYGFVDLGKGNDYNFTKDLDEYKVINGIVVNAGADDEKLAKLEEQRKQSITDRATELIENKYSPLKQRKLLSIAVALQDKKLNGLTLTEWEEAQLQINRDVNAWIGDIRSVENVAIAQGTALVDVVWGV